MTRACRVMTAVMVGVLAVGCSSTKDDDGRKKKKPETRAVLVGRVASIRARRGFVLIQSYGAWVPPPGAPVFSCGDCEAGEENGEEGRMANLMPSGEKMGQFVAADVRSGQVEVGDAVYYRPGKKAKKAPGSGGLSFQGLDSGPEMGETAPKTPPKQDAEMRSENGKTAKNPPTGADLEENW